MLIAIIILIAVLIMLFYSKRVRRFSWFRWVLIVADIVLIIFCASEMIRS